MLKEVLSFEPKTPADFGIQLDTVDQFCKSLQNFFNLMTTESSQQNQKNLYKNS